MTPGIIIFWHLVFAFVGILIGIVIGYQWERRSMHRDPLPAPEPKAPIQANPGAFQAGWTADGSLWLEMNGVHLVKSSELNPDQRKRLTNLVRGLGTWVEVGKPVEPVTAPAPVKPLKAAPAEKKPASTNPAMESIIEQINSVLQKKLDSSVFKDRGIQLVEGAGGSVIVEDGLKTYDGIDSVPDAEIKSLIRDSIAEWEKSSK